MDGSIEKLSLNKAEFNIALERVSKNVRSCPSRREPKKTEVPDMHEKIERRSMRQTTVVNLNEQACDIRICRPGPLGNPFAIGVCGTREDVIHQYKKYFLNRVARDQKFRAVALACRGKVLGCFCKPLSCHGDVIVEWLSLEEI